MAVVSYASALDVYHDFVILTTEQVRNIHPSGAVLDAAA